MVISCIALWEKKKNRSTTWTHGTCALAFSPGSSNISGSPCNRECAARTNGASRSWRTDFFVSDAAPDNQCGALPCHTDRPSQSIHLAARFHFCWSHLMLFSISPIRDYRNVVIFYNWKAYVSVKNITLFEISSKDYRYYETKWRLALNVNATSNSICRNTVVEDLTSLTSRRIISYVIVIHYKHFVLSIVT